MSPLVSSLTSGRALLLTPFCHQRIAVPDVKPTRQVMREVLPQGRVNDRDNELTVFLQQLPARCDKAKQDLLQAQRASKYYRTRYGRGLEMRRRQYQQLLNLSDAELQMWARSRLRPARLLMPKLVFVVRNTSPDQQKEELAETACHRKATANDINEGDIVASTAQIPETPVHFPSFHLSVLPPTSGIHRSDVRALLVEHVKDDFRHHVVNSWAQAAPRQVVIIGCQSTAYLRRLLSMGDEYSFLIMDRMLSRLLTAAESLVPEFGPRTQFVRSDAFFLLQQLLPPSVADTCVVPMPVPFWSEQSSHQRLVTRDFFCVIHRILKERESPTDPRGFVTFTDAVPLAEFMMEQLMESRLIVPWVRKNPAETYGRWLPLVSEGVNDEFSAQRRLEGLTALAASKSGPTSPQADAVIQSLEYKRRYYRALSFPAEG